MNDATLIAKWRSESMRFFVATLALAATVGSTAVSEAKDQHSLVKSRAIHKERAIPVYGPGTGRQHSPNPAWDVYDIDGTYIGSDPDPLIRSELRRDDYVDD
jgi:hypothetical protein